MKPQPKSEAELEVIPEATPDEILAVDNQGQVVKANCRFAGFCGIPQALLEGRDDQARLAFVVNQLSEPEALLENLPALYESDAVDLDPFTFTLPKRQKSAALNETLPSPPPPAQGAPSAPASLVDEKEQWRQSKTGLTSSATAGTIAWCGENKPPL